MRESSRSSGREKQRSRTGCRTCRSRKVKCDERPGGCHNCARLNLPCPNSPSYDDDLRPGGVSEGEFIRTQAGLRRSRTYRSCRSCRLSKSRCSGERPSCLRCREREIDCSYDGKQAPAWLEAASLVAERRLEARGKTPSSHGGEYSYPNSPALSQADSHKGSQSRRFTCEREADPFSWLTTPELPRSQDKARKLVEAFFVHFHSLRSFGFVHKPTIMQQLDRWSNAWHDRQNNALLLVICALGAKFCALQCCDDIDHLTGGLALSAGSQWAWRAHQLVVLSLNHASVETTMAIVLLHEHELRVGNHANAFMLTGLAVRMAQALQINLESPPAAGEDVLCAGTERDYVSSAPATTREARRRLMWSIYIMDSWVGSGVDELTLVDEADLKIRLPCSDGAFNSQGDSTVEMLHPEAHLPYRSSGDGINGPVGSLDLRGCFIRLVSLRRKVLRYVKHLDRTQPPWSSGSEFAVLQSQLRQWLDNLPKSLRFNTDAIYARKETSQLGGMLFCHFTYHQTMCDLTRIGMRDFFTPRASSRVKYLREQASFLTRIQDQCFEHCMALCALYDEALKHGPEALADTWLSIVAFDSAKIIIQYISTGLGTSKDKGETLRTHAIAAVHSNIRALESMVPLHFLARSLHSAAVKLLLKEGLPIPPQSTDTRNPSPLIILDSEPEASEIDLGSPAAQYAPESEDMLHPLAIFRMARRDIVARERHLSGTSASFSGGSAMSDVYPSVPRGASSGLGPTCHSDISASSSPSGFSDMGVQPASAVLLSPLPSFSPVVLPSSPAPSTMFVEDSLGAFGGGYRTELSPFHGGLNGGGQPHPHGGQLPPPSTLGLEIEQAYTYIPMMTVNSNNNGMGIPPHGPISGGEFIDVPATNLSEFPGYPSPPLPPPLPVVRSTSGGGGGGVSSVLAAAASIESLESMDCMDLYQENMGHVMSWDV